MSVRLTAALCASAAFVGLIGGARIAVAQSDQPAASAGNGLEEVVVTARRREEKIQTVPIAITAFTQADIEKKSIHEMHDLAIYVPSLGSSLSQSDSNGVYSSQLRLRGLPGTEIYLNDVPIGNADFQAGTGIAHGLSEGFLFDLDGLEVVKGPQGTLFGKNSVGGLISIKPKHPTNEYEGYAKVTFGNYGDKEVEAAVNIPIIADKLLVRAAIDGQMRDGYTKDLYSGKDLDNKNYQAWRLAVTARPTDDIEDIFTWDGYLQDTNGSSSITKYVNTGFALTNLQAVFGGTPAAIGALKAFGVNPVTTPVTIGNGPAISGLFSGATFVSTALAVAKAGSVSLYPGLAADAAAQDALGPRAELGNNFQGIGRDYFYGLTNSTNWDISDNLTIKNIAAARIFKEVATIDYSPIGAQILNIGYPGNNGMWGGNNIQYSEELQFQGKALADKLSYVLGGYLEYDKPLGYTGLASANLGGTVFGGVTYNHFDIWGRSQAAFGTATYDFGDYVSGLKLTGGYRYTFDFSEYETHSSTGTDYTTYSAGLPTNCPSFNADRNCFQSSSKHFQSPGWNVSLEEQLDPDTLLYIRSGNAYRPGGFNTSVPNQFATFGPEHVTDVEGGAKLTFTVEDMTVRTNFDGFHSDYKAIQVQNLVSFTDPTGKNHTNSLYQNAASASINGGEFEGTILPMKGVELNAHASYIDAKYDKYPVVFGGGNAASVPFLYFPRFSWGAAATYHLPIDASYGDVAISANWSHYGHQTDSSNVGEAFAITPAHDLLNMRIDWTDVFGQPVDAGFFMNNVLDTVYVAGAIPIYTQLGFSSVSYGAPRMFGFSLKYRFNAGESTSAPAAAYVPPPAVAPAPSVPKSYLVFFDFNKSDLTSDATTIVDQAAKNAGPAKVTQLTVTGHTDTVGSDAYNLRLSRRRAESVAAQLEKDGIPSSEIEIVAKGKRDLLVPTKDGVKEPQNRRVQIVYDNGATS